MFFFLLRKLWRFPVARATENYVEKRGNRLMIETFGR